MVQLPQLKKKVSAFLTKEDGKISKENLIKTGILVSIATVALTNSAKADCPMDTSVSHSDHCNAAGITYATTTATGSHSHSHSSHASHSSHSSHSSHASHSSHGSHGSHTSW